MKKNGVAVIGSMTADVTAIAQKLPQTGETVIGNEFTLISGGKGANQAVMAAHMDVPTWIAGCIGEDPFRHVVLDSLQQNGVNTEFVHVLEGEKTGIAHIRVDESANNDIVIVPLANLQTDQRKVDGFFDENPSVNVLLLQLEIPSETTYYAAKKARQRGMTVIFDPAPAVPFPEDIYQHVDMVTPNETEASLLTGVDVTDFESAEKAAKVFLDKGVKKAIITLGYKGVLAMDHSGSKRMDGISVDAVDSTAAGDAFTGALGAGLAEGQNFEKAIRYAMAAGALAVTKLGAQSSLPTKSGIEKLLEGS